MAERSYDTTPRDSRDDHRPRTRVTGRLVWGLIILGLGTAWTLDNLGLADSDAIVRWWPMLLMAYGAAKITGWGARRAPFSGTLFMIAGVWLMLHELGYVATGLSGLWPLALILIGGRIVLRSMRPADGPTDPGAPVGGVDERGRVKVDVIMASVERRIRAGEFSGGEVNAIMSGVELD